MDYKPRPYSNDTPVDPKRCRAAVHDGGRSVLFHQCFQRQAMLSNYCRRHTPNIASTGQVAGATVTGLLSQPEDLPANGADTTPSQPVR